MASDAAIESVYADALIEVGQDKGILDELKDEFGAVANLLTENEAIFDFLRTPNIPRETKLELLEKAFKGKCSEALYNFLAMVVRRKRETALPGIWAQFLTKYREAKKLLVVQVFTSRKLVKQQREDLIKTLSARYKREVTIDEHQRSSLIGGLVVDSGFEILDFSIKARLDQIGSILRHTKMTIGAGYED